MLNRLFIVLGVLAILAIASAFVVPRFIQWGDYRDRLQVITAEAFGAPVEIAGEIGFSLLPQPRLNMADLRVGDPEAPTLTVAAVEAEFSLFDFLRDRYAITRLVLEQPTLGVSVDENGAVETGLALPDQVNAANISVSGAQVIGGRAILRDARSGSTVDIDGIEGQLRLDAANGPFGFQGHGVYADRVYDARIGAAALSAEGNAQLSIYLEPADDSFSLSVEGVLRTAGQPGFGGRLTFRQRPPAVDDEAVDAGRGDLLLTSAIDASTSRILLSDYTIVPDENRTTARLTGAAEIILGAGQSFNAVISGGVLGLPPRDATEDQSAVPFEFVRLLADIPVPPATGMPGTVNVDIAEANLRAFVLRNIRLDAATDGRSWSIETLSAQLPGNAALSLSGSFNMTAGRPSFAGSVGVRTARLDALAQLWRRPPDGNPLFNMPGSLSADLSLVGETISVSNATLTIAEQPYRFDAEIGFEPATRHLNLSASLGTLDAAQSRALLAFLPEGNDGRFGVSFPRGEFEVDAEAATIAGLAGSGLFVEGFWEGGVLAIETLTAEELGGVGIDARLTAFGSFSRPEFSGTANVSFDSAAAPALAGLYDAVGTPPAVRDWLAAWAPAELVLDLGAPDGNGGQQLALSGTAGPTDIKLSANLGGGIVRALGGPIALRLDLASDDATALTGQIGLGDGPLTEDGQRMSVVAVVSGTAANSFETTIRVQGGSDLLAFSGNVVSGNLSRLTGNGNLQVALSDPSILLERMGLHGLWSPAIEGSARIDFEGAERMRLGSIRATSSGDQVSGALEWTRSGSVTGVAGELAVGSFSPTDLLRLFGGPASVLTTGEAIWPDGPFDVSATTRSTTGRIRVVSPGIALGGNPVISDASFDVSWDAEGARLRNFEGSLGGGTLTAELSLCCTGPLPLKQFSGRAALSGVDFAGIMPSPVARAISGTLDAATRFSGTGDSMRAVIEAMTGEGTYSLADVTIEGFDPTAFDAIETLDAVLDLEPAAVSQGVLDRLDEMPFAAETLSGSFTIAGGVLRSPNLAIEGSRARLFGSTTVRLTDLGLGGGFAMTPTSPSGPDGMLTATNAQITAQFGGTLPEPEVTFDVTGMVDTIMVEAYQVEVARLEQLRAEEEARARQAAEERARIAAEAAAQRQAEEDALREEEERLRAEEEAARLAEEEAERVAAEQEAARRAEEEARRRAEEQAAPSPFQLQPGFNLSPSTNPF